jgi:hypothetical protein
MTLLKNNQTVGSYHYDTVREVIGDKIAYTQHRSHLIQRACARLIEEAVELCLTAGMSTGQVYEAVTDSVHNEALKAKAYPITLKGHDVDNPNMIVELTDNAICADYIRHLCKIEPSYLELNILDKLELLRLRAMDGELKEVDFNIYKKSSGR